MSMRLKIYNPENAGKTAVFSSCNFALTGAKYRGRDL